MKMQTYRMMYWLVVLAYTACMSVETSGNVYFPPRKSNNDWWSNTIIYQAYPRSFKDSNNDGVGDLKGITQKLDHFVDLGIETIWVGPILCKSPMVDNGYGVENYTMIDPIFGTIDDFDELVLEMNKRDLKLIIDFIPNHSSDKCEWFQKSIKREGKYDKYYIWHDAKNQDEVMRNSSIKPIPPNNWISLFENFAWSWNEERKQFYFHQFSPNQPDFNLRNLQVHLEFLGVLKFWLDRGVSGFRVDALRYMYENELLHDDPYLPGKEGSVLYDDLNHIYTADLPEVIDTILDWRNYFDNYTKTNNKSNSVLLVTESYTTVTKLMKYYGNETIPGSHIPFNFGLIFLNRNNLVKEIDQVIKNWLDSMPENMVPNWVVENHDRPRLSFLYGTESISLITALEFALPGVAGTYYGSEIGMDMTYLRPDQYVDTNEVVHFTMLGIRRDFTRTPMQWDNSTNAGFTGAKNPWLPVNPNYYKRNVETQKKIPTSHYSFYKKMSQLRKTNTLKYGDLTTYVISKSIYILKRSLSAHESYLVVMNFGSGTESIVLSDIFNNIHETLYVYLGSENSIYSEGSIVYSNSSNNPLKLRPQSVVVLSDKHDVKIPEGNGSTNIELKLIILLCSLLFTRFLS